MIHAIQSRINRDERGFTLIELMVVVLIIAILIAIAIPTFLGARSRAQDRAAQSDLRNALLAAEVHYTDNEAYNPTVAELDAIEPEYTYVADVVTEIADGDTDVHFLGAADEILFVRKSAGGTFFCIAKTETGGTFYNSDTTWGATVNTVGGCDNGQNGW